MILEVDDRGRIERFAVTGSVLEKTVDGRKLIGGTRLVGFGWEEVLFEDLPCVAVNVDDPYVQILTEEE